VDVVGEVHLRGAEHLRRQDSVDLSRGENSSLSILVFESDGRLVGMVDVHSAGSPEAQVNPETVPVGRRDLEDMTQAALGRTDISELPTRRGNARSCSPMTTAGPPG